MAAVVAVSESKPDTTVSMFPSFHLLCMQERFSDAFHLAVSAKWPELPKWINVEIHNSSLKYLDSQIRFDAVVSPANSYARLDGAFDDALARAYGPIEDYGWITRRAQKTLYEQWRGFAPPGTCTIVPLGPQGEGEEEQPWGTKYLLLCPTMAVPCDVNWDREVVYECIWSMLCAVDKHNRQVDDGHQRGAPLRDYRINSILMTPLATGVGRIRADRWAEQLIIALKHWKEAVEQPQIWSSLDWQAIYKRQDELEETFIDDVPGPT